jgi:oligosaccharide 4-alpha-D-glucosyltransferase
MKDFFRVPVCGGALAALSLLVSLPAQAQRAEGGPPAADPFGRRVVPARAVPGGRYAGHVFHEGRLSIGSTDGTVLSIERWMTGVVKIKYYYRPNLPDSVVHFDAPPLSAPFDGNVTTNYNRAMNNNQSVSTVVERSRMPWKTNEVARATIALEDSPVLNVLRLKLTKSRADGRLLGDTEPDMVVLVQKSPLRVSILHGNDTLVAEATGAFRRVAQTPASTGTSVAAATFAPGGVGVRFRLAPGERLYGTGSRALPLNRRGYRLELYNQAHYASQNGEPNLNITLPTVLSSRGYMLFFDNYAAGYLDLGKTDKNVLEYGGEGLKSLSYFVITGRDQAEILDRYTALTGRQPLPPRWALGLIQSRFGYKSDAEMQQVTNRMRRENFPLDALVLDLYWFGGTKKQGDFAWEPTGFPDPAGMMDRLKQQGVKTILISEPYVMRTSRNDSLVRTQGLVGTDAAGRPFTVGSFWAGPASILDVFKPQARNWLWSNYRRLHNQGVAGWWSDLGEPENHPVAMQHAWGPTRAVHNAYGQVWAGIFRDNYAREFPEERVFNLARSGWAGLQRNGVFPWSGDINRSWSGFQAQVPVMLGMGQGGVGYMHSDAGGFCAGGIDPELYTRWLQMASLCPILRPHGEGVPPEPYFYPEPYKSAVRAATHLRYELLPYLYTLAWQNTTTGAPLVRSLDFGSQYSVAGSQTTYSEYPTSNADYQNTQYLLGPNLLVAPVLHPSQRQRNVALPTGNWVDFYSNQTYAGNQTVAVPAPLAHTPLLVRAGALLPMTAYRPSTDQFRADTLRLRYYPDAGTPNSSFTMYEDDGHSAQALEKSAFDLLAWRGHFDTAQTTVELHATGGRYAGQPARRTVQLEVARVEAAPTAVLLDGQPLPAAAVAFSPATGELHVEYSFAKPNAVLELRGLRLHTAPATNAAPEALTLEAPDQRSFGPNGTTLHYATLAPGAAQLRIRNAQGQLVRTLPLDAAAGPHALRWNACDDAGQTLPPGVYTAETAGQHQRLILTR